MNGITATFTGRLSFDPELRYTSGGKAVLNLSLGVSDGRGGVEWVKVALWEELAEQMAERLEKGDQVYVEGRLKLAEWTGQDGQRRAALNVTSSTFEVLGANGQREPARQDEQSAEPQARAFDALGGQRERIAAATAEGAQRAPTRRSGRR